MRYPQYDVSQPMRLDGDHGNTLSNKWKGDILTTKRSGLAIGDSWESEWMEKWGGKSKHNSTRASWSYCSNSGQKTKKRVACALRSQAGQYLTAVTERSSGGGGNNGHSKHYVDGFNIDDYIALRTHTTNNHRQNTWTLGERQSSNWWSNTSEQRGKEKPMNQTSHVPRGGCVQLRRLYTIEMDSGSQLLWFVGTII